MSNKLKNFLFHFFGISLYVGGFVLSMWLGGLVSKPKDDKFITILMSVFFFAIYNFVTMGWISQAMLDGKKTVLNYVWYFKNYLNIKWVCHSELGYFPTIIGKRKLTIYEQGIFSIKKLTSIDTDRYTIDQISNSVKSHLDWVYKNYLEDTKENERLNVKQAEIKKWDGYLDIPTRRDKKIDELLK
jgi:hypothetical protein